ncbi:MAG: hypothetical protein EOO96_15400 [Pedobacter sp.]|nr:MAG: hypothetical protein EOO96_15400 [Pedobacter sp.]
MKNQILKSAGKLFLATLLVSSLSLATFASVIPQQEKEKMSKMKQDKMGKKKMDKMYHSYITCKTCRNALIVI